jgi:hypothetical protein
MLPASHHTENRHDREMMQAEDARRLAEPSSQGWTEPAETSSPPIAPLRVTARFKRIW